MNNRFIELSFMDEVPQTTTSSNIVQIYSYVNKKSNFIWMIFTA